MNFDVITLFPKAFELVNNSGVITRALEKNLINVNLHDLREYGEGSYRQVDDKPYGGGSGANEDKEGFPFVGRAGQLLDKMLNAINLSRRKVYITNVVNYRPPENRKPTEKEVERYLPYLKKHIEIIKPKIILLLGSTAMNAILKNADVISKMRGKWIEIEINKLKVFSIVSFHPAYLLRQPDQKKFSWIDLKMIREKLRRVS